VFHDYRTHIIAAGSRGGNLEGETIGIPRPALATKMRVRMSNRRAGQ
jgi:hypothetical protein